MFSRLPVAGGAGRRCYQLRRSVGALQPEKEPSKRVGDHATPLKHSPGSPMLVAGTDSHNIVSCTCAQVVTGRDPELATGHVQDRGNTLVSD